MTDRITALLPCPFCGTVEMLRLIEGKPGYLFVRCDYCDAEGPCPEAFLGGWNRRADLAAHAAPAEVKMLAENEHSIMMLCGTCCDECNCHPPSEMWIIRATGHLICDGCASNADIPAEALDHAPNPARAARALIDLLKGSECARERHSEIALAALQRAVAVTDRLSSVQTAAQAVLVRWDSRDWKAPPTADAINALRAALKATSC